MGAGLRLAGDPRKIMVVSDSWYSDKDRQLIRRGDKKGSGRGRRSRRH